MLCTPKKNITPYPVVNHSLSSGALVLLDSFKKHTDWTRAFKMKFSNAKIKTNPENLKQTRNKTKKSCHMW